MGLTVTWAGNVELVKRLKAVPGVDYLPLMKQWAGVLVEGNRRGVLSGRDGFDQPMPPLQYRNGAGKRTANRKVPNFGTTSARELLGTGANLTTRQYQQLTGPRLAPRREQSRVIANLRPEARHPLPDRWEAIAAWRNVVSRKGIQFLPFHFAEDRGKARSPRYDLRPVRPKDYQFCLNQLRAFARQTFFRGI
jgi:hypothetical protein